MIAISSRGLFVLIWLGVVSPAAAQICPPVTPVPCANCFAVVVMPDTQYYTDSNHQPHGAAHLDLVGRYLCRERTAWVEPSTGKQMPIEMVIQLGDLVQNGDKTESGVPLAEWIRADAAFDHLDSCSPNVPYLVTNGNHDVAFADYEGASVGYEQYFGASRWSGVSCANPANCNSKAGEYFIGGGDPIAAHSRNNVGSGSSGPAALIPGRHRAGVIRAPTGQRFLFLGLEMAFDFPPPTIGFESVEGDDSAWPKQVMADYAGVPTIAFHHSMFLSGPPESAGVEFGPETWHADSLPAEPIGMKAIWDELIDPNPQVLMFFAGHVTAPAPQGDYTVTRVGAPPVHSFLRNFQNVRIPGQSGFSQLYGVGWNVVAVFDPDAGEIRVRSYRVDDEDAYATPRVDLDHDGEPAPTECFDTDQGGFGERIISVDFSTLGGFPELPAASSGTRNLVVVSLLGAAFLLLLRPRD